MNAQKVLIGQLFTYGLLLEVPFFQRSYVWNEELWDRFISDMEFIRDSR